MAKDRRDFMRTGLAASLGLPLLIAQPSKWALDAFLELQSKAPNQQAVEQAKANIEKHRKGNFRIKLIGRDGQALAKQKVSYNLQKHHFPFGVNWKFDPAERGTIKEEQKLALLKSAFNYITLTSYWSERSSHPGQLMEPQQGRQHLGEFEYSVHLLKSEGFKLKGHPLFSPVDKGLPQWLKKYDLATQWRFVEVHTRNMVQLHAGKIDYWDAVNESIWEPTLMNRPLRQWPHLEPTKQIAEMNAKIMAWARDEDPHARYLLNDYGLASNLRPGKELLDNKGKAVTFQRQRKRYKETAQKMAELGQAPDGLGLQCHTGSWQYPAQQAEFYRDMGKAGFPLHITEFWAHYEDIQPKDGYVTVPDNGDWKRVKVSDKPEDQMGQEELDKVLTTYVADYLTVGFGSPEVGGFSFWGLRALVQEHNNHRYMAKPQLETIQKKTREEWHSHGEATTNGDGEMEIRGFFGSYSLEWDSEQYGSRAVHVALEQKDQHCPTTVVDE